MTPSLPSAQDLVQYRADCQALASEVNVSAADTLVHHTPLTPTQARRAYRRAHAAWCASGAPTREHDSNLLWRNPPSSTEESDGEASDVDFDVDDLLDDGDEMGIVCG